jgi:hypothetical protein
MHNRCEINAQSIHNLFATDSQLLCSSHSLLIDFFVVNAQLIRNRFVCGSLSGCDRSAMDSDLPRNRNLIAL